MGLFSAFTRLTGNGLTFTNGVLSASVDGSSVTFNGLGQLQATGGGGGSQNLGQVLTVGNDGAGLNITNVGTITTNGNITAGAGTAAEVIVFNTGSTNAGFLAASGANNVLLSANRNPVGGAFVNSSQGAASFVMHCSSTGGSITFSTSSLVNTAPIAALVISYNGNSLAGTSTDNGVDRLQISGSVGITGTGTIINEDGSLNYADGGTLADGTNDGTLYYGNGNKLAQNGALYYADGTALLSTADIIYYGDGSTLADATPLLYYPGTGNHKLADANSNLFYPGGGGQIVAQGASLFYPNQGAGTGDRLADVGVLYPTFGLAGSPQQSYAIDADGHLYSLINAPTIAAGPGLGTSPTVAVAGTDQAMTISFTVGTLPTINGVIATVTFKSPWKQTILGVPTTVAPTPSGLCPQNVASAAFVSSGIYVSSVSSTTIVFTAIGTLSAGTYKFSVLLLG